MNTNLFNRIVAFLEPYMMPQPAQETLIHGAFFGTPLISQINSTSTAHQFAVHVVKTCNNYGTIDGELAIVVLLKHLRKQVGENKQAEIDDLITEIKQDALNPEPPLPMIPAPIPSKNNNRWIIYVLLAFIALAIVIFIARQVYVTSISEPTHTPTPTNTPTLTHTPIPTNTSTDTPIPTNTSTDTPMPTNTSTDTPMPTNTPTDTPIPTIGVGEAFSLEGETICMGGNAVNFRGRASNRQTYHVISAQTLTCDFLATPGEYTIEIRYSNDQGGGGAELLTLTINGETLSPILQAVNTRQSGDNPGDGWNRFYMTPFGSQASPVEVTLSGTDRHTLTISVSAGDGFGVEIDRIDFSPVTP